MYYVEIPAIASIIVAKKTTTWGESGFPARLLEARLVPFTRNLVIGRPMPRLQVNLSFTAEAFEVVKAAAESQEVSVTAFCRGAIMDAAEPLPEDLEAAGSRRGY